MEKEVLEFRPSELSLLVWGLLKEKLEKIERLERIVQKSKLSQEKAEELAERFNERLFERYEKLYKERLGK